MNHLIRLNRTTQRLLILALGCFALSQRMQAVNPPPDGGYAGGNTARGKTPFLA